MKNTLRKTLSLFLAFTLLCSLGLTAAASEAMGAVSYTHLTLPTILRV